MCEVYGEVLVDSWMDEVHCGDQPHLHCRDVDDSTSGTTSTTDARSIRNALVQHLSEKSVHVINQYIVY